MDAKITEKPVCWSKSDCTALIHEIMGKYDITTPEGQEQFTAELAFKMADHDDTKQRYIEGQETTIHRYESQHANLVKENGKLRVENNEFRDRQRTYDCRLKYLEYWKQKAADLQKAYWTALILNNDLTKYIELLESKRKDTKEIKNLKAQINSLIDKIDKQNETITQQAKDYLFLERVNSDIVDYADAEIEKVKAEAKRNEERLLAYIKDLEARIQNLCSKVSLLEKDIEKKDKKLDFYATKKKEDSTTTGNSSSKYPDKKVVNTRKKSDNDPGAQIGHPHHPRKSFGIPTEEIALETPDWILNNPDRYRPLGTMSYRELGDFIFLPIVTRYSQANYLDTLTGKIVHGLFPDVVPNEVNYGSGIKAFAFLLMDKYNVSVMNTQEILKELSKGAICPSTGFLSQLCNEFALKTTKEREEILNSLTSSHFLNADFTFGRLNGELGTVLIITNGEKVMLQEKPTKGYAGIAGSILPDYEGVLVSDSESALKKTGKGKHQQCLAHVIRYLLRSILYEPELTWQNKMLKWIREAIEYWAEANSDVGPDDEKVNKLDKEYDEILQLAAEEYKDGVKNPDFRDGLNTYKRMSERKEEYVLFLHDPSVPPTNNAAEIMARKFKRKSHQAMTFRSLRGFSDYLCGLSVLESFKSEGKNLFLTVTDVFGRPKPPQPPKPKKAKKLKESSDAPSLPVETEGDLTTNENSQATV